MAVEIVLSGPIGMGGISARFIREELAKAKGKPVVFLVNSPGGFVFEGIEIFNLIRAYQGKTEARITGIAASMGSYIVLAADKVSAYENAIFMIHNALAITAGNHNDMRKTANTLEQLSNILAKAYAKKTGKELAAVKELMDDETYLFGNEILSEGFIDEILEDPDEDDVEDRDKETALLVAKASVRDCFKLLKNNEAANKDIDKAVAYVDSIALLDQGTETATAEYWSEFSEDDYSAGEEFNPEAPYPNEHACRVREPGEFAEGSFRRISRTADGKRLDIIIGKLKGKTTTTTQAFRYPKGIWSASEARKHCRAHDGKTFEPATGKTSADNGGCGGGT